MSGRIRKMVCRLVGHSSMRNTTLHRMEIIKVVGMEFPIQWIDNQWIIQCRRCGEYLFTPLFRPLSWPVPPDNDEERFDEASRALLARARGETPA